ncbi:unnamed protein product [Brassica rapa subsp. trilocularis]
MQKTVRSLLMSSGSSFVSSLMPGRSKMEYQFHRRNAPITRVSSDQIQESGNQKRIIQPISQNLQIEPDSKKTRVDNNRRRI